MGAIGSQRQPSRQLSAITLAATLAGIVMVIGYAELIRRSYNRTPSKAEVGQFITSRGGTWKECGWQTSRQKSSTAILLQEFGIGEWPIRLWSVNFANLQIGKVDLAELRGADFVRKLDLSNTQLTDDDLDPIGQMTRLGELNLANTRVTDKGLAKLKSLKELVSLNVTGTAVTYAGLAELDLVLPGATWPNRPPTSGGHQSGSIRRTRTLSQTVRSGFAEQHAIRSLRQLKALSISFSTEILHAQDSTCNYEVPLISRLDLNAGEVGAAEVDHFPYLQGLRDLTISGETRSFQPGFAFLAALSQLESLSIVDTNFNDVDLRVLEKLPNLKYLRLVCEALTDEGIASAELPHTLEALHLRSSRITPAVIAELGQLQELRELELHHWVLDHEGKILKELDRQQIDDLRQQMAALSSLPKLEYLILSGNFVVDDVASLLVNLKSLRQLDIPRRFISPTKLDQLRQAIPQVEAHSY